jgi:ubiquinone biosynthesis protein
MPAFTRLKRLSEIGTVLARYGLTAFLPRPVISVLRLDNSSADEKPYKDLSIEERVRRAFEDLGTTFIKLGQILSLRGDIIPHGMVREFRKLQDNVRPVPYEKIKPIIEDQLMGKIEDVFSSFDVEPVASASISQVYSAVLKEEGKKVVVKVRKPDVVRTIKGDMEIILWLADIIHRTGKFSDKIDFKGIAEEFFTTMNEELDLVIEKKNTQKFANNFSGPEWIWLHFPEMYDRYCTNEVLVMEYIEGYKLSQINNERCGITIDRKEVASRGAKVLIKMMLEDGFFHADLHSGNLFFHENSAVSIIDCGMSSNLDRYLREKIADMFIAFAAKDYTRLSNIYIEISESGSVVDRTALIKDIRKIGESLPDNLSEINTAEMMQKISSVLFKYKLRVPREFTQLIRSLIIVEGLCRELDPEFELLTMATELSKELLVQRYTPERIATEVFSLIVQFAETGKKLPMYVSDIMEKIESGRIQHRLLFLLGRSERSFLSKLVTRVSSAAMIAGSLIASGSLKEEPYSWIIWTVFGISALIFLLTFLKGKDNDIK